MIVCSADVWIHELFLFKDLCMQVGAFCGEFSEKGLAICGLPERISRETTLFMPMLVVRIVDLSRHPLFSVTVDAINIFLN